jgi:hemolysin III
MLAEPAATSPIALAKPRLRGVLHEWAFYFAIPLGVVLGLVADTARARVAAAVFAASVVAMFGASALYHRVTWSPARRRWMRGLDHAGIYTLIAGTYTPFGLLVLTGDWRFALLATVWSGSLAAIVIQFVWAGAPKWVAALIAIALGWLGVVVFPRLIDKAGIVGALLVIAGGLCYTVGAVIYARGKPDPFPTVFGYHELFHALVIAAVAFQYAAVAFFVLPR